MRSMKSLRLPARLLLLLTAAGTAWAEGGENAAQALARYRIPERDAASLANRATPAWVFLAGLKLNLSSTALRNADGSWKS